MSSGNIEQVSLLLANGADPDAARCTIQPPPLHIAITLKQNGIVCLLLDGGANPDARNQSGITALLTAIGGGNNVAVQHLLEHKANPNLPNAQGDTPMAQAIGKRNAFVVGLLCDCGARLQDSLAQAISVNEPECAHVLIAKGADKSEARIIEMAEEAQDPSIELLIKAPAPVPTAKGIEFLTSLDRQFSESISKIDRGQGPRAVFDALADTRRKYNRFSTLLKLRAAESLSEVQALLSIPVADLSPRQDEAVKSVIQLWAKKIDQTNELLKRLGQQVTTDTGVKILAKWNHLLESRRVFLEALFDRGIDETLASRSLREKQAQAQTDLDLVRGLIKDLPEKQARFAAAARQIADETLASLGAGAKQQYEQLWAAISQQLDLWAQNAVP